MNNDIKKILYYDFRMPYLLKNERYPVGGATVEWKAWIKGLEANGFKVCILSWKGSKQYLDDESFCIVESYSENLSVWKFSWLIRYISLYKAIKKVKPDFIFQECAGSITGVLANISKSLSIPFVYRVANDMEVDGEIQKRLTYFARKFFTYGLRNASLILSQNNYQFDHLYKIFPHKKIYTIPSPFDFDDIATSSNLNQKKYISWIGIFQYQKNLPFLLEIVRRNPNLKFKIAGKSPDGYMLDEETKTALDALENSKNVEFVGYLNRVEIHLFLQNSFALLNTSHYEGFPITYMEALANGIPIITTKKCDPDDFISENKLGFVFRKEDLIEQDLLSIVKGDSFSEFSARCRSYVLMNHDVVKLSNKIITLLKPDRI
jgi:glycosyltransferase involved in cell wall biosynthesis